MMVTICCIFFFLSGALLALPRKLNNHLPMPIRIKLRSSPEPDGKNLSRFQVALGRDGGNKKKSRKHHKYVEEREEENEEDEYDGDENPLYDQHGNCVVKSVKEQRHEMAKDPAHTLTPKKYNPSKLYKGAYEITLVS